MGYDAFLLLSFGGPEGRDDVVPFLENVLRGRNVPRERLLAVAEHYYHFDGISPINEQNRDLIAAIESEFREHNVGLPIYWGNRNWHPMLADTVAKMRADGVKRVLALATSAYGSYSGCRQYREDLDRAIGSTDLVIDKLPPFSDHPGFIEALGARLAEARAELPDADVIYTAHSVPLSMAQSSPYEAQLRAAAAAVNGDANWKLVYQSRSGPPTQPWLGPDIADHLRETTSKRVIVMPIGFLSDHMEVLYDLDTEAAAVAKERDIDFLRAATVGTHPAFVRAVREMTEAAIRNGITTCGADCCKAPERPVLKNA